MTKKIAGFFALAMIFFVVMTPIAYAASDSKSNNGEGTSAEKSVQSAGTCSIGAILGRLISSTVGKAMQQLTSYLSSFITSFFKDKTTQQTKESTATYTKVPIIATETNVELTKQKNELRQLTAKETGQAGADTDSLLSGFLSGLSNISLDSIMFCVINEIMTYITNSTIEWINSGFNGSPVFVENPRAYFENIANKETSNFVRELQGAQSQVTNGIRNAATSIAAPLRDQTIQTVINSSNLSFADIIKPTMSQELTQNYQSFVNGDQWLGMGYLSQLSEDQNNYYGVQTLTLQENARRIAVEQQNQQLQLQYNNGYKSFTECPEGHSRADGSCDPAYSKATVTGSEIKDELQSRGMMKYMRTAFANDFDSIITTLINQLVKIAVNEVFQSSN